MVEVWGHQTPPSRAPTLDKSVADFLGKVDANKLKEIYSKLFPDGAADKFASLAFCAYDKNGDGYIDFREFIAVLSITSRGSTEDKLKLIFSIYDLNGDGKCYEEIYLGLHLSYIFFWSYARNRKMEN